MEQIRGIEIVEMTFDNKDDYECKDQPFMVIGRLIPKLENGIWSYHEELYEQPYESKYPEHEDLDEYINSNDSIAFLYYSGRKCLGHIRLGIVEETKFASIDRLIVLESSRGKGIGTALLNKAREWALQKGMQGFMLETQDVNLLACRFYLKNGFDIGAVDTMLYSNSKYKDENAVFFYSKF
ncbi:GNAT family N-acetyltransferase [Paenibacillus polymyxa]|uniref:GNAT family N-acetyltransferase n=1 Tax=Paenibacillus polymyxa TaxID=1406 RepID=UPI000F88CEB9|nr:GNAT family N-acetyltransferase [Paenibacillus polymyxa]QDA29010.1 GNAT family N-acetyltransferase [Paenibacillus polymyxa]RTZ33862.1 GNAT family N-acetyltransferase [Paenibacillus polymyxa]URJ34383.1 GNAT family N-acetyltransferase [Paenibacillus polymyxa]